MTTDLPSPVNHVFVDFENVHEIDLAIFGSKAVSFTLLLGARQTKLDADLVEKLLEHAASVQLVRLASAGKNALDFTLWEKARRKKGGSASLALAAAAATSDGARGDWRSRRCRLS